MSSTSPAATGSISRAILRTALLAGTLDITAAMTNFTLSSGKNPLRVLPYVASGLFGPAAFSGSVSMLAVGLLLHYLIALAFTCLFFWLYPRLPVWLARHRVALGLLYGAFVWVVMNLLVVPLSRTPKLPFNLQQALINVGILMLCIGLPIALLAARFYAGRRTPAAL